MSRRPTRERLISGAPPSNGGAREWSVHEPSSLALEQPHDRPLHGVRLLHGGLSRRAHGALLPSYVRGVPWITSVKRH